MIGREGRGGEGEGGEGEGRQRGERADREEKTSVLSHYSHVLSHDREEKTTIELALLKVGLAKQNKRKNISLSFDYCNY